MYLKSGLSELSHFLEGRTIHQITAVGTRLWCVLDDEIALYQNRKISYFSKYELNIEGKLNDVIEDGDYVLIASSGGIYRLPLRSFLQPNKRILPKLYVKGLTINGTERNLPDEFTLTYGENNLQFEFGSVFFRSSARMVYHYTLINQKTDELFEYQSSSGRHALYNLAPGKYKLLVKAISGSVESTPLTYFFKVKRPFYMTWLFWIATLLVLSLISAFVLRLRVVALKKEQQRIRKLYEFEQQALRAKMNPHFLFNVLNSIQQFFLRNDGLQGHKYLKRFAELVRLVLKNTDKTYVTIEEELDYLGRYVELEQLRSNTPFEFRVNVAEYDRVKAYFIPSMTIQPFIENSIWHAFKEVESGLIELSIRLKTNCLHISIQDNGLGFDPNILDEGNSNSKGISIVRERLKVLKKYGHNGLDLSISSDATTGTRVGLIISTEK